MINNFKVRDRIRIEIRNPEDGSLIDFRETFDATNPDHLALQEAGVHCFADDLILDAGLADLARMVAERYPYVSVGNGTTTPVHDNTGLESELMDRVAAATSLTTTFYTNDTACFSGTFTPVGTVTVSESGIHTTAATSGDICFARETFTPMSCVGGRAFTISWQIIFMR